MESMVKETDKMKFILRRDGIMQIDCAPGTEMTMTEGRHATVILTEMIASHPRPLLCDLTNVMKMTRECRQHFASEEHAMVFTKCALLISSPIARIIGNFFLSANVPAKPTRLFTNKEEAINWLKNKM